MSHKFAPRVGAVFSADIAVPEHERVLGFYTKVLTTGETPLWQEAGLLNNLGFPIIGLGKREGEYADLPLQWMPHFQVADVAASVAKGEAAGGRVIMHGKDDAGNSQWAVLADPNGAAFGMIPLVPDMTAETQTEGQEVADQSASYGHIAWLDLTVPNATAIRDFYKQVLGLESGAVEMQDGDGAYADYTLLDGNGDACAGVCHARGQNVGIPPVWMIYLPVGDMEESLRRVEEEGGKVVKSVQGEDGTYFYAAVVDPVGVVFGVVPG